MTWYQDLIIMIWNVITSDWFIAFLLGMAISGELTDSKWRKRSERHG
jgi:hypothetical protein